MGNRNLQKDSMLLSVAAAVLCSNKRGETRDSPALVPSVHCEIFFLLLIFFLLIPSSEYLLRAIFILLRLYGEMFYIN